MTGPVISLDGGSIEVHQVDLDATTPDESLLSPDELTRASRFRADEDRHRFLAGRTMLRHILASRAERPVDQLKIVTTANGKPVLADSTGPAFNMSRSQGLGLYAVESVGTGGSVDSVGVDVEYVRPLDPIELAERVFAPQERSALEATPPDGRLDLFFELWVRKEAVVKADGRGLSVPLDRFSTVGGRPGEELEVAPDPDGQVFVLRSLQLGDGVKAAVAAGRLGGRAVVSGVVDRR